MTVTQTPPAPIASGRRSRQRLPRAADRPWFRLLRQPGRFTALGVGRLLLFQLLQIGLWLLLVRGMVAALLGGLVCLLTLALGFGRWQGRWVTEQIGLWWRLRQRQGLVDDPDPDPRLAALGQLVPDLAMSEVRTADGTSAGLGSDGAGWFMALEVPSPAQGVQPPVPLAALARIANSFAQPGAVIQVVSQTVPAPALPLADAIGHGGAAKVSTLWVTTRLDAAAVADSLVDRMDADIDIPAVLTELTRRVSRALRRRGLTPQLLTRDELLTTLTQACDLTSGQPRSPQRESWQKWRSERLAHRCFWVRAWPDPVQGTELLAALAELPAAWVTVAMLLQRRPDGEDGAELRSLVRIATAPAQLEPTCRYATQVAAQMGAALFPLNGEHALGVYATVPSGGGAR